MSYGSKEPSWTDLLPSKDEDVSAEHVGEFFRLMFERQEIWYKRFQLKQPRPWTTDPYLRDYKFTNVYRELDRASQWLIKNVMLDWSLSIEDLIWKIFIFRFYNQPDTFDHNVYFVHLPKHKDFNPRKMWLETVTYREKVDNPWHTAYMMNMAFAPMPKDWKGQGLFKDEAYVKVAFPKIHAKVPEIAQILRNGATPEQIITALKSMPATADFQAHEFYIDFCYVAKYWKQPIMEWNENDYTNVGPGASLGLRLTFPSLSPAEQIKGIYWLKELAEEQLSMFKGCFKYVKWDRKKKSYEPSLDCNITLHQIEMWLCEYQKYWKMKIKAGKQRSKFSPKTKA